MISGKGGVGKTSLSASLAVKFAEQGHDTLVVSTDPAHSLGDSFAQDISGGKPVPIEGTDLCIWGMEVDPNKAAEEFKAYAKTGGKDSVKGFLDKFGMGGLMKALSELKLDELLDTAPPGLDEAVAISKVVEFVEAEEYARFTRIVFDTAPTGHTLRMLSLPDFVGATLQKVTTLRNKLSGSASMLAPLFGNADGAASAVKRLEKLQERVGVVRDLFRDHEKMEFVIATIPTVLGINESSRLLTALRADGVPARTIIVNQVVGDSMGEKYLRMKVKEQEAALAMLRGSPSLQNLDVIEAKLVDLEVRGLPALQYFGSRIWPDIPSPPPGERRFFLLGGKGGVGKTTLSASLAMQMASRDVGTLIVSTDPAHSLSDSLGQFVGGGKPVRLSDTDLPIWGMQIDPEEARQELREMAAGDGGAEAMEMLRSVGMGGFAEQLQDLKLGELLDNPPPGIDEAVAVSKVVRFMRSPEYAHFGCIIFDTAPTGHTLRLLTLPDFLEQSVGKIVRLRFAIASAVSKVTNFFKGKSGSTVDKAMSKLQELQGAMDEARSLFRDETQTEFIIVTIPTVMAMAESERLAASLQQEQVPVRRIVVNQLIDPAATNKFMDMRRTDQHRALDILRRDPELQSLTVVEAPLLDLEVRGVPALQYFGNQVWKEANIPGQVPVKQAASPSE